MRSFLFLLVLLVSACIAPAQRFVKTVNSWADLLSLNPNDVHTNAFVNYGFTVDDTLGGIFTYYSTATDNTNDATVLKPYSYNGRWMKRMGAGISNYYATNIYGSNVYATNLYVGNVVSNFFSLETNITVNVITVESNAVYNTTNVTILGRRVTMYDFDPNQFDVAPAGHPAVYDVAIKYNALVTNLVSSVGLTAEHTFALGAEKILFSATAATNDVLTEQSSWIEVTSDSAVPGARVLRLNTGFQQGQLLIIKNAPGGNTFLLPNSSAVVGGGQVNLSGTSWQAAPDESMLLIYDAVLQDWFEIGRFGSGTTAGLVANLTPGYIPYATSTNTLGDSPFYRSSANVIGFGGTGRFLTVVDANNFVAMGPSAGPITPTDANDSVAIGDSAASNVSGVSTGFTVVGYKAGYNATSLGGSTLVGENVYVSATGNVTGVTAIGAQVGFQNQDDYTTLIGYQVGAAHTNMNASVVVGAQPFLGTDHTGRTFSNGVWIGYKDLSSTNYGSVNNAVLVGYDIVPVADNAVQIGNTNSDSLYLGKIVRITPNSSVAMGANALKAEVASLYGNIAIGTNAAVGMNNSIDAIAIGRNSLDAVTSGSVNGVVAIGTDALGSKTSGQGDVAVGYQALRATTTGAGNVAVGRSALLSLTTGNNNVAIGENSGRELAGTAIGNALVGNSAGYKQASGNYNAVLGATAAYWNTAGTYNTVLGGNAMSLVTNISKSVVVGSFLQSNAAGSVDIMTNNIVNSVFIGYKDTSITNNVPGLTNVVSIGYNTIATNNNQMVLGNASNTELLLGANRGIYWGSGAPAIIANRGSLYLRTDGGAGTTLYVKEADDGAATGWAAK